MRKVQDGHGYSEDVKLEVGMTTKTGPWDKFVDAVIRYLPVILVMLMAWVIRVEQRIGPNGFSASDGIELREALPSQKSMNREFQSIRYHLERLEAAQVRTNRRIDEVIVNNGGGGD